MDKTLSNALRRKSELERELEEINIFIRLHSKFSAIQSPLVMSDSVDAVIIKGNASTSPAEESSARKRGRPADFVELMKAVLMEAGRPLSRPDFVVELERRGVEIPSEDKPRYLGTILWRNRRIFRNLLNHGYWLASIPYPPAGYDPATDTEAQRVLDMEGAIIEPPPSEDGANYAAVGDDDDDR
ncbi:hypothetical protein K9U39_13400 [Rhodoblastus acidophilus]|uniref:HTH HARE-type domain-containing protein n=1 Tax=Candidatus Rhodoblastus alkanivorans TaxID=2954117 RepID=A0ABS9ZB12_9HYPH|nr:hypothetical protein [Candidatus Rhodoblastus alkanivorans]MCI4677254.1 hypothetical protein [Candidatus Rhodoblastus alkanivorans]MCI4684606.1 hypothetical protein [Candidatus Rhodoblastus alkanivorans]MDI4641928.1 hypothetical protein [Rhodoblastus acidophilus]